MKLYAKIKAHKKQNGKDILVEKGQGTNEYIGILLNDETGKNLIEMYSEVREDEIYTHVMDYSSGERKIFSHELPNKKGKKSHDPRTCENSVPCLDCELLEKGEKQKGEAEHKADHVGKLHDEDCEYCRKDNS